MKEKINELLKRIKEVTSSDSAEKASAALPDNCYFLDDYTVACLKRDIGDSRYPYSQEGYTLWAHSSGYISVNESTFYVILPAAGGKEPFFSVFFGIKQGDAYRPVSLFDVTALPDEQPCERYTVYTPQAVYYIAETDGFVFALRAFVTQDKEVCLTLYAENTGENREIYISPYINCLLKSDVLEHIETNWFKECRTTANGYIFTSVEDLDRTTHIVHYGVLNRTVNGENYNLACTTARTIYTGGTNRPLMCSPVLRTGKFGSEKYNTRFTDTAVAADMVTLNLANGECFSIDYKLTYTKDAALADKLTQTKLTSCEIENNAALHKPCEFSTSIEFGKQNEGQINSEVLNKFIKNVQHQVEFAALAKNSGVSLLGVRDVFQQIEAALMWNPTGCRAKILEALNFIDISGRSPRQYSIPQKEGAVPRMDLRPFIDQGVWIIDTLHTYLSYTGDDSILGEICGYYDFSDGVVKNCAAKDSVLDHLIRITDYMVSKIDTEYTNCLRAIYGDWNDALDGLGVSMDGKDYGSGVSVMASLQLYKNLAEMIEILSKKQGYGSIIEHYAQVREQLKQGILEHAVEVDGSRRRILHGWGDKVSYKVGSFCDTDGASRDSLTANAFWIISDFYREDNSLKQTILDAFDRLDSKYGLKTFEPYFPIGMGGVGRIINLPKGTAENSATYVHAALFGIWALFNMGEPERAWAQLNKVLPITHSHLSTTPFIMSNSYSYNEEYGMDGESMSDWFTGSANVFIKVLVRCVCGVNPDLNGITIAPAGALQAEALNATITVKGVPITLQYENKGLGQKKFFVNGVERESVYDTYLCTQKIYIANNELIEPLLVKVIM